MKHKIKNKNGITLIALVITIIVLLILAGIAISMLTGDNSILRRAGEAKDKTDLAGANEQIMLAYINEVGSKILGDIDSISLKNALDKTGYEYKQGGAGDNVSGLKITEDAEGTKEITGSISIAPSSNKTVYVQKVTNGAAQGDPTYYVKVSGKYHKVLKNGDDIKLEEAVTSEDAITGGNTPTYKVAVTSSDTEKTNVDVQYNESTGEVTITSTDKETTTDVTITIKYANKDNETEIKFAANELYLGVIAPLTEEKVRGKFVNYGVTYTDVYKDYSYTSTNGWRMLHLEEIKDESGNGTGKYNVDIISTGIPARLYYYHYKNTNVDWWGTPEQVKNYYSGLGTSAFQSHETPYTVYSGYYASYGLIHNFENITFKPVPESWDSSRDRNYYIFYKNINGETSSDILKGDIFKDSTIESKATSMKVRSVTSQDFRSSLPKAYSNVTNPTRDEDGNDTGLFLLGNIKYATGHGVDAYVYYDGDYWFANPNSDSGGYVWNMSSGSIDDSTDRYYGIRPVVSISDVEVEYNSTTDMYTLK